MASYAEIVAVLGIVAAVLGYWRIKEKALMKKVVVGGAFFAFVGAAFGGLAFAGVPAFLSTGAAPTVPQGASLWIAVWSTSASDTDRTETELLSTDGHSMLYIMSDNDMDGLGDVNMGAVAINQNVGKTTDVWQLHLGIVSVGTVIVSGLSTPVANWTADRSRFNIAYSEDSGPGTLTQVFDYADLYDVTTGGSEALSIDLPIDPAVTDDLPAGAQFTLVYDVGGVTLTVVLQES